MACKVALLFLVLTLIFGVYATSSPDYEYCVVGAGPGGMELSKVYLIFIKIYSVQVFFFFLSRLTNGILSGEGQSKLCSFRTRQFSW